MILFILAAGGLGLVVAFVHYGRTILRWGLRATAVTAGFFLWLSVGHFVPLVGYLGYTFPFVVAAWFLRGHILAHFPRLAKILHWVPTRKRREFERAFRDELDEEGKPQVPRVTRYEQWENSDA